MNTIPTRSPSFIRIRGTKLFGILISVPPTQTAAARPTTSGSASNYPEHYMSKSLDEDLDSIICYLHPGDNPDTQ
jgi:hypothetical protein